MKVETVCQKLAIIYRKGTGLSKEQNTLPAVSETVFTTWPLVLANTNWPQLSNTTF